MSREPSSLKAMDDDLNDSCAQCGTKQNAASNLNEQVFRVNTAGKCGHKFCQQCVEREFSKKRQFSCPKCKTTVTLDKVRNVIVFILCAYGHDSFL